MEMKPVAYLYQKGEVTALLSTPNHSDLDARGFTCTPLYALPLDALTALAEEMETDAEPHSRLYWARKLRAVLEQKT